MAENIFGYQSQQNSLNSEFLEKGNHNCFKEAVCIDAYRVYDSCADKDCLEDLRVYFTESGQHVVDQACNVKMRGADIITVYVNLEPVPFNKGFYSVDMTFFFEVNLEVFFSPTACPVSVCGLSIFNKKVILYGSEGNVKIFNSSSCSEHCEGETQMGKNLPKATVQAAEPIALAAKLSCECHKCCECKKGCECNKCCECKYHIPEDICRRFGGEFILKHEHGNSVYATIGLFTIVQLERNVQMLIPAYDFCIPEKECVTTSDNPCELFGRIEFPTDEFFPPQVTDLNNENGCGCGCCKH